MYKFISHSENETIQFSHKLAEHLQIGDIIILTGDLGSRKNKIYSRNFRIF